jgi:transcriptional regulator with XRE-family HTH domain
MDLYPNLKLEIFKRGLRQSHLARELGINEANLSKIIHGYREPSTVVKQLLAGFLGVDIEWLFERYNGNGSSPVSTPGETPPSGKVSES